MAHYRKIDPKIWNDEKFMSMSAAGQLACFFMLTHPHMTAVGGLRATIEGLASEHPQLNVEAFREAFREGLAEGSQKAPLIWFPRFLKYNPPESPNVVKAWNKALDYLPECETKNNIIRHVKGFLKGFGEAFQEAFTKALPESGAGTGAGTGAGITTPPPPPPSQNFGNGIVEDEIPLPGSAPAEEPEPPPPKPKPGALAERLVSYLVGKVAENGNGLMAHEAKLVEFCRWRTDPAVWAKKERWKTEKGVDGLIREALKCQKVFADLGECLDVTMERGWRLPDPEYLAGKVKTIEEKKQENGEVNW